MTTKITSSNIEPGSITSASLSPSIEISSGVPKISNLQITDSSYAVLDDTAVSTSGGYIKITGSGFVSGCQVIVGDTLTTTTTFVSGTEVQAQVPAKSLGTYTVYLVNPDGGTATRINGLTYSGTPVWVTASQLSPAFSNTAISMQLSVTSDSTVTYSLDSGSQLPQGLTLSSTGLLSGSVTVANDTSYNFTVLANDQELQTSAKEFTLTVKKTQRIFTISPAVSGKTTWNLDTDGALTLGSAGNWTLTPQSNFSAQVKMWGAGSGGNTRPDGNDDGAGGAGGYSSGLVTFSGAVNHLIYVGSAGNASAAGQPGGGVPGGGGNSSNRAAGGGGYSGIFRTTVSQATAVLIAGGGGGSNTNKGGAGGGTTGQAAAGAAGQTGSQYAQGGTQSAGGTGLGGAGSALQGGSGQGGAGDGGGGGGGYWGGAGGGNYQAADSQGSGGGGSGYYNPSYVTNGYLETGNYHVPGNHSDSDRGTAGSGSAGGGAQGYPGLIKIS
jgi:hypothetical protein